MKKQLKFEISHQKKLIAVIIILLSSIAIVFIIPPPYGDWHVNFHPISKNLFNPYLIKTFNYPPWATILLYPLGFFSENTGGFINACLNILVIGLLVVKRKGGLGSLILTLTSFPFLALISNGNVEWIPALGFIFQNGWGLPFLLIKPQSGFLAIYTWLLPVKNKTKFFIPIFIVVFVSFIIWGNWIVSMFDSVKYMNILDNDLYHFNLSLFPWTIPIGLGLIFYLVKYKPINAEILGIIATLCFFPYFATQSLTILFALISVSYRRIAIVLWVLLWVFLFNLV
jgi:flagellar biosynthesis protein FliQ